MQIKKSIQTWIFLASLFFLSLLSSVHSKEISDSVYYEIFVRSFQDSNGDGIGDLKGITSRLDQLKALGVDGLWLTPIVKSASYHGYDAIDFRAIQAEYGNFDDFNELIREAHTRGLKVLLDIAVNHTSTQHPWFIDASSGPQSPFRDHYVWKAQDPHWKVAGHWNKLGDQFYWSRFNGLLPDLNWKNPAVLAEVKSILSFWSRLGVDGFRLDAARYYVEGPNGEADTPETHQMIKSFAGEIRNSFPNTFFIGEIWADSKTIGTYLNTKDELDLAFNFPLSGALLASLKAEAGQNFSDALGDLLQNIKDPSQLANFTTNHDMKRLASQITDSQKLRLAAEILFSLPGTPFIYYGEEIGMSNNSSQTSKPILSVTDDKMQRTPMLWNSAKNRGFTSDQSIPWQDFASLPAGGSLEDQMKDPNSLWSHYHRLIDLRNKTASLRSANLELLNSSDPGVSVFLRRGKTESTLVVINFSKAIISKLNIELPVLDKFGNAKVIWGPSKATLAGTEIQLQNLEACRATLVQLTKK